jgi:hypothetical protein
MMRKMRTKIALVLLGIVLAIGGSFLCFRGSVNNDAEYHADAIRFTERLRANRNVGTPRKPILVMPEEMGGKKKRSASIGKISGLVWLPDGSPALGALITVMKDAGNLARRGDQLDANAERETPVEQPVDESGHFTIEGLSHGQYAIHATLKELGGNSAAILSARSPYAFAEIVLHRDFSISGRVESKDGRPVPSAIVRPYVYQGRELNKLSQALFIDHVDNDGRFQISGLAGGEWILIAESAGLSPTKSAPVGAGTSDCLITMQDGGAISGKVVSGSTEQPMPELALRITCQSEGFAPNSIRTSVAGDFFFQDLAEGKYVIDTESPLFFLAGNTVVSVSESGETSYLILRALPAASISGRVKLMDGGPAEFLTIAAEGSVAGPKHFRATTDSQGLYTILGLRADTYVVRPVGKQITGKTIHVASAGVVEGIDFEVGGETVLSGKVVNVRGEPIPLANVELNARIKWLVSQSTVTEDDGTFAFHIDGAVGEARIRASHSDIGGAEVGPFSVPAGGLEDIIVKLDMGADATLSGQVVDRNGTPVPAHVQAIRSNPEDQAAQIYNGPQTDFRTFLVTTDADGQFLMRVPSPNTYQIRFSRQSPSGNIAKGQEGPIISLAAGETKSAIRLVSNDAGLSIAGRVLDTNGLSVRYARVSRQRMKNGKADYDDIQTNRWGHFSFDELDADNFDVVAKTDSGSFVRRNGVAAGTTDLELVLQAPTLLSGTVVDGKTGEPVSQFEVGLTKVGASDAELSRHGGTLAFADPQGHFEYQIDPAQSSGQILFARAAGRGIGRATIPAIAASVDQIVIALTPGITTPLDGFVRDDVGQGVQGARIYLNYHPRSEQDTSRSIAVSDASGLFHADGIPTNTTEIWAVHPSYGPAYSQIELTGESLGRVEIVVFRPGTIEGSVFADGEPVTGTYVMLSPRSFESSVMTDEQGHYRFARVGAGEVIVRAQLAFPNPDTGESAIVISKPSIVEPGETTLVDFNFPDDTPFTESPEGDESAEKGLVASLSE